MLKIHAWKKKKITKGVLFVVGLEDDPAEKEEKLERKVNAKPRLSSKRAARSKASSGSNTSADDKTSRYFQSPLKEEVNSEDDFEMGTAAPPVAKESTEKQEEEGDDDDSEDEDDWEEVEGKCGKCRDFMVSADGWKRM